MTYKANVEVKKFSRSGWDTYEDSEVVSLYDNNLSTLKQKVQEFINNKEGVTRGDFGCVLSSTSCKVLGYQEVVVEQLVNVL